MFEKRHSISWDNRQCLSLGALGAERCEYVLKAHVLSFIIFSPFSPKAFFSFAYSLADTKAVTLKSEFQRSSQYLPWMPSLSVNPTL